LRFLLDENFPLALLRRLRESGYDAEHLITLGQRGLPDAAIQERLENVGVRAAVRIGRPEVWQQAIAELGDSTGLR
jgi:hypothetical protein